MVVGGGGGERERERERERESSNHFQQNKTRYARET